MWVSALWSCRTEVCTHPVGVADVVAACVQPEIYVAVLVAVLLAILQHARKHILDGAVVASAVTRRQDHDVAVPGRLRISLPSLG